MCYWGDYIRLVLKVPGTLSAWTAEAFKDSTELV